MATPTNRDEYIDALRMFLRDHPGYNRLLGMKEENTDEQLGLYLDLAISFLNNIPPPIGNFNYTNFPNFALLIHQATVEGLISNGIVGARNELTYNNGGITVQIENGDRYLRMLNALYRQTDLEIRFFTQQKVNINIQSGFGGVHSPYLSLSTAYSATLKIASYTE